MRRGWRGEIYVGRRRGNRSRDRCAGVVQRRTLDHMMNHYDTVKTLVVQHQQDLERDAASWRKALPLRRRRADRKARSRSAAPGVAASSTIPTHTPTKAPRPAVS